MEKRLSPCNRSCVRFSAVLAIFRITAQVPIACRSSRVYGWAASGSFLAMISPTSRSLVMASSTSAEALPVTSSGIIVLGNTITL